MSFRDWLVAMFTGHQPVPDPARQELDTKQLNIADRLSRLQGKTRDEVLSEAYRRARTLDDERSYRRGQS